MTGGVDEADIYVRGKENTSEKEVKMSPKGYGNGQGLQTSGMTKHK